MAIAEESRHPRMIRDPRIHSGEPVVRGARGPVRAVVVAWRAKPDMRAMLEAYPCLTEADVRGSLDYYKAHRDELDARIKAQLTTL